MRRGKLGDVYAVKVPNGYKLYQWAYHIPNDGDYIRVFDGLYATIPENIAQIVEGPHSYITSFLSNRAYRVGLAQFVGNWPVPREYPFPEFMISFWPNQDSTKVSSIWVMCSFPVATKLNVKPIQRFNVSNMRDLPDEYQQLTLLNDSVTPAWLFFLFDYNFTLANPERFWPRNVLGDDWETKMQVYLDMVENALANDPLKNKKKKETD